MIVRTNIRGGVEFIALRRFTRSVQRVMFSSYLYGDFSNDVILRSSFLDILHLFHYNVLIGNKTLNIILLNV